MKGLQPTTRKSQSEIGPCQVLPLSFEDQLGTPDLLAVPSGAAFIPAFVPDDMTFASDDIDPVPDDIAPDESRSMKPVASPRPPSSRRAWEAPPVQQVTGGTPYPDQKPLSSVELAEASAFCLPAEQTRGLGAKSQSEADQRPLATVELSEATSVTTDGTPLSPDERDGKTTVYRCEAPMHKTGHWPVYPRQVRTETLKARPPAGGTAHSRHALEATSVQQVTGGIPNTYKTGSSDARPPSSEELMGAPAVLQPSREDIHKSGQPLAVEAESATFPSVNTAGSETRPPTSSEKAWEAPSVQHAIGGTPSQDQTECLRGQYLRHTSGFKCAGAVSFGVWDDQHPDQRPLPSHDISEIPQETDKVGDTDQTLLMAPYTGSCGSAMCPEISVPKCHDERVSFGADDPISGEVCLDCAFIQACNTTQEHEARSEQVGGASMPARGRVVGCPAMLSTVGTELSSLVASDSTEASDRAAVQTPCCHGVQRKADGIRVSHVSIVGDGPISGVELADSKRPKTIAKDPRQDEVGEELCDQSGAGSSQSCPVEIEARSRTATPRVEHVSAVADDPISGGYGCRNNKECVIPRLVDDDTSSGEEDDNSDDTSSGEEDYNSDSDGENEGEETWYDAINGHKCRWQENENIVSTESNDTGDVNEEESNASVKTTQHADDEFTDEGEYWASYNTVADTPTRRQLKRWAQSRRKHNLITAHSNDGIKCKRGTMVNEPMVNRRPLYLLSIYHLANKE